MAMVVSRRKNVAISPSLLTLLYVERGWTLKKIAKYLGHCQQTVLNHMQKHGIRSRHRAEHFKGCPSHRRGKTGCHSPETLDKMSRATRSRWQSGWKSTGGFKSGPDHWNWQGGIHVYNERGRKQSKLRSWRTAIYRRDNFTCQVCTQVGGRLNAHHIEAWSKSKNRRFELDNGVTLCQRCHVNLHKQERS